MEISPTDERPYGRRIFTFLVGIGLVVGAGSGWASGKLLKAAKVDNLTWSDDLALALGIMLFFGGLVVGALSVSGRGQALLANSKAPEFDRRVGRSQIAFFRLQSGVVTLAGLLLAAPVAFKLVNLGGAEAPRALVMAGVLAGFGLQTALNVKLWFESDEVYRKSIVEAAAASFWLLQGLLFLWASGEKISLLPKASSWDLLTVTMAVYLVSSSIVGYRKGLQ